MTDSAFFSDPKAGQFLQIFGMVETEAGSVPSDAFNLGGLSGSRSISGFISDGKPVDVYSFKVDTVANFVLGLTGLSADADVAVFRDLNSDGEKDYNEEIEVSDAEGTANESLNVKLTPGNYFVEVYQYDRGGNTLYNLNLSANPFPTPAEAIGKSLAGASDVGTVGGVDTLTGTLSSAKNSDIYKFKLETNRSLSIDLEDVSAGANLQLIQDFNGNQVIDAGEAIETASATPAESGTISYSRLAAGDYFVRVQSASNTDYSLSFEAPGSDKAGVYEIIPTISANETVQDELVLSDFPNPLIMNAVSVDYDLTGVKGNQKVDISLTSSQFDPALQLINKATGELIAENDNIAAGNKNSALSFTADPDIDYRIRVTSTAPAGQNTGGFTLTTSSSTLAGNLGLGQSVNAALTATDLIDDGNFLKEYRLTGLTPGQQVRLNLNSTQFDPYLELVDAVTGLVIDENDDINSTTNRNSQLTFTAEAGAEYLVRVTAFDNNATGNFTVTASNALVSPPVANNQPADFFSTIADENIRNIAKQRTANGQLDRNGMLAIYRQIAADNQIAQTELNDLKALAKPNNVFSMPEPVRYLATQVATEANQDVNKFKELRDKHFLGTVRPAQEFLAEDENNQKIIQRFEYKPVQGNLFGPDGPKIGDIAQGPFANCYFGAGLAAMFGRERLPAGTTEKNPYRGTKTSQIIKDTIFANTNEQGQFDGTYTVRFYEDGKPGYLTIDNQLITDSEGKIAGASRDRSVNNPNNVLWVPLLERAFAQAAGSYEKVVNGGSPQIVQTVLIGRTADEYSSKPQPGQREATFVALKQALDEGKTVTAARYGNEKHIVFYAPHAYAVTDAYVNAAGEQRVVVYNPHGADGSPKEVKITSPQNDGFVDVSFEDFKKYMDLGFAAL